MKERKKKLETKCIKKKEINSIHSKKIIIFKKKVALVFSLWWFDPYICCFSSYLFLSSFTLMLSYELCKYRQRIVFVFNLTNKS